MTKKQREQVVELLRCAADLGFRGVAAPLTDASYRLGMRDVVDLADKAIEETVPPGLAGVGWSGFAIECLEAAACVEEGSWP